MTYQYQRRFSLIVSDNIQGGLELKDFRVTFQLSAADVDRPPTAVIRIYNLKDYTAKLIEREFSVVTLQAGYESGKFGVIFSGQIMMIRRGREDAITSYLTIYASDGDEAYTQAVMNTTLAAQNTAYDQRMLAIQQAMAESGGAGFNGLIGTNQLPATGGIMPRGRVLYGMARAQLNSLTQATYTTWFIQDGQVHIIEFDGYRPGEAVVLTSKTGMIGVPEATNQGLKVRCLINPLIKVGCLIKLDNASVNAADVKQQGYPEYSGLNFIASADNDGFYRVLVIDAIGDTRGNEWYQDLVLLHMDPTNGPSVINPGN